MEEQTRPGLSRWQRQRRAHAALPARHTFTGPQGATSDSHNEPNYLNLANSFLKSIQPEFKIYHMMETTLPPWIN